MASKETATEEPPICEFKNWDEFYPAALRYHQSTHPGDDMVIDRIATFRRYMSKDVIKYLDGFVRLHPRFNTSEGWTQWREDVTEMFSISSMIRDKRPAWVQALAAKFSKRVEQPTTKDLIAEFQKSKINIRQFWQGLDVLVCDNVLSSSEQRQLFWGALPEEEQKRLVEICHYFDPQDEIWEKQDSEVVKVCEQKLSQIMEFSAIDQRITVLQQGRKYHFLMIILESANIVMGIFKFWEMMEKPTGYVLYCYIVFAGLLVANVIFCHLLAYFRPLETLTAKRAELLSGNSP